MTHIMITNMDQFMSGFTKTKIKTLGFLKLNDYTHNACSGMIFQMVYEHEVDG